MRRAGLLGPSVPASLGGWRERWRTVRDSLLSNPAFQRWAGRFPLTRPIARRHAGQLFDICAGFVYAQVLVACIRLRLFDLLADAPRSAASVAGALDLPPAAADRLLAAAAALRLLERRGNDRYGLGPLGAAVRAQPGIARMVEHHALLYADLADPVARLRAGAGSLAGYWPYAGAATPTDIAPERVAAYSALMAASMAMIADGILDAYDLRPHRRLLDVGGGDGAFLAAAAARAPHIGLMLFDLPPVAARARTRLPEQARIWGGDFRHDPLPVGADIVSLIRIVHDHDDATALAILANVRRALPPDGTLLLAEPMTGSDGIGRATDAYLGIYLLAMGSGRPRAPDAIAALLWEAGFDRIRELRTATPLLAQPMIARVRPSIAGKV